MTFDPLRPQRILRPDQAQRVQGARTQSRQGRTLSQQTAPRKFVQTIAGDGATVAFTVTHNWPGAANDGISSAVALANPADLTWTCAVNGADIRPAAQYEQGSVAFTFATAPASGAQIRFCLIG